MKTDPLGLVSNLHRFKLNIIASKKVIEICKYFTKRKGGGAGEP